MNKVFDELEPYETKCLLDDGTIHVYDLASSVEYCERTNYSPNQNKYEYLGEGVVYSVDGVLQNGTIKNHYWRKY